MKNACSKCRKDTKILYPGDLCPGCYGDKVPGSNEREKAWKGFMEKRPADRMIDGGKKDSEVVSK